jgi:hypothetical protein
MMDDGILIHVKVLGIIGIMAPYSDREGYSVPEG